MFPTPQDTAAHRRARTRQERVDAKLEKRISEVTNPDELVDAILEITTLRYRQGKIKVQLSIGIPPENFTDWANNAKIISPDSDQLDRKHMQREITRLALDKLKRLKINGELGQGVILRLVSGTASKQLLNFTVEISVFGNG
jgi:hypothetical protein